MYAYNSTIKLKIKPCISCGKPSRIFSKGRCQQCATIQSVLAKEEKEVEQDETLSELVHRLDAIFSKYIRLKYADEKGMVECYTSRVKKHWTEMQCGHFISRSNFFTRWDERNCRPQTEYENCGKHGNIPVYAAKLEQENPGITEYLLEESRIVYKPTHEELKQMILNYHQKVNELLKQLK